MENKKYVFSCCSVYASHPRARSTTLQRSCETRLHPQWKGSPQERVQTIVSKCRWDAFAQTYQSPRRYKGRKSPQIRKYGETQRQSQKRHTEKNKTGHLLKTDLNRQVASRRIVSPETTAVHSNKGPLDQHLPLAVHTSPLVTRTMPSSTSKARICICSATSKVSPTWFVWD